MKITIDASVKTKLPELRIFFEVVREKTSVDDPGDIAHQDTILTDSEFADYQLFRKKISGDTLLAVERLLGRGENNLPRPDPLTSFVIKSSYKTRLPVTIFCNDSFGSIVIRFSAAGEILKAAKGDEAIDPGALIADTDQGILGVLGTKSSTVGELSSTSKSLVVLSFGCTPETSKKSKKLVSLVSAKVGQR